MNRHQTFIKEGLLVALDSTLEDLGPLPDALGNGVSSILESDSTILMIMCGVCLEQCVKERNYSKLEMLVQQMLETGRIKPVGITIN